MVVELIITIECRYCHQQFGLCRSCYRGQRYCCDQCRKRARRKANRLAQQRYRQTDKGRKAHREAENRRRQKKNGSQVKCQQPPPPGHILPHQQQQQGDDAVIPLQNVVYGPNFFISSNLSFFSDFLSTIFPG